MVRVTVYLFVRVSWTLKKTTDLFVLNPDVKNLRFNYWEKR